MEKHYDIFYKDRKLYENLSAEDCTEILQDFSEKFYEGEEINLEDFRLEESYGC